MAERCTHGNGSGVIVTSGITRCGCGREFTDSELDNGFFPAHDVPIFGAVRSAVVESVGSSADPTKPRAPPVKGKRHVLTPIAPSLEADGDGKPVWRWCIRCGTLELQGEFYRPGAQQRRAIEDTEAAEECRATRHGFSLGEVGSIYVDRRDRFVVSLVVGYGRQDGVKTPIEALQAALELTTDEGSSGTHWFVHDRTKDVTTTFEQCGAPGVRVDDGTR